MTSRRRTVPAARPFRRARGFLMAYLLFALALAGVVTVGLSQMRNTDVQAQLVTANVERLMSAISTIRGQVIVCAATYPVGGSVTVPTVGTLVTEFPVLAESGGALVTGSGDASAMQCPGAPSGMRSMWSGRDGIFFPPPVTGFQPWQYTVTASGSPLRITSITLSLTNAGGSDGMATLRRVLQRSPGGTVSLNESTGVLTVELLAAP